MSESTSRGSVRFDGTVNAGHLLQAAVITVGFVTYLAASSGKIDGAQRGVEELRARVETSAITTREEIKTSLSRVETAVGSLQGQIANLPDLAARIRHLEELLKRLDASNSEQDTRFESRRLYVDSRIEELRATAISNRAEIDSLRRLSGMPPLPSHNPAARR